MKSDISLFIMILFLLISCEKEKKAVPKKQQTTETKFVDTIVPNKVVSHESEAIKNVNLTSILADKVNRLSQLEHNYLLKNLEVVQPEKTVLLGYLEYVATLKDSTSKVIDFQSIKNTIHEIRKAFLKSTKPMHANENTYPKSYD